jgi:phosphohistidine phosphatase
MKTLLLARHAKSNWGDKNFSDFDRPLNETGKVDAPIMAMYLQQCGYLFHQIISSDAARALETAEEYKKHLTPEKNLITHHDLYLASADTIVDIVSKISPSHSAVIIVGHNPGISDALNYFCKENFDDMSACGVGIIQFEVSNWVDIAEGSGDVLGFESPKTIKNRINS